MRGPVPVFGTPSASRLTAQPELTAQYQIYDIEGHAGEWRIVAESRVYSLASASFVRSVRREVVKQDDALVLRPESAFATCRKSA